MHTCLQSDSNKQDEEIKVRKQSMYMYVKIPWRRDRLPTPVFWPREFHGL